MNPKGFTLLHHLTKHTRETHDLKGHMAAQNIEYPRKCDICGKSFAQEVPLRNHIRTCLIMKAVKMDFKTNKSSSVSDNHSGKVLQKTSSSSQDQKSMTGKELTCDQHMRPTIEHPHPHKCDICGKAFAQELRLRNHITTCLIMKAVKMDFETNKSSSVSDDHSGKALQKTSNNSQDQKSIPGEKLTCNQCGKHFALLSSLKAHIQVTHTDMKPYKCGLCKKGFAQSDLLANHMITHPAKSKVTCGICDCSYKWPSFLKMHMYKHTGEKPYKCDFCDKAFAGSRTYLFKHMLKAHPGEKLFKCKECGDRFSSLEDHAKIHNGESKKTRLNSVKYLIK